MENLKRIKDIEKLCKVENFILEIGRPINNDNKSALYTLEKLMQDYTYGWYILQEDLVEQLISINQFKVYILNLIKK